VLPDPKPWNRGLREKVLPVEAVQPVVSQPEAEEGVEELRSWFAWMHWVTKDLALGW